MNTSPIVLVNQHFIHYSFVHALKFHLYNTNHLLLIQLPTRQQYLVSFQSPQVRSGQDAQRSLVGQYYNISRKKCINNIIERQVAGLIVTGARYRAANRQHVEALYCSMANINNGSLRDKVPLPSTDPSTYCPYIATQNPASFQLLPTCFLILNFFLPTFQWYSHRDVELVHVL